MKKVLILQPVKDHHRRALGGVSRGFEMIYGQDLTSQQRTEAFHQAEVIFGEPSLEKVKEAGNLEWIQMTWAGADRYTMGGDFPQRVALTIATGAYGATISEYILGALLAVYRRSFDYKKAQATHHWGMMPCDSLEGKTALILGGGDIGTETAKRLQAFGVNTLGIVRRREIPRPYFTEIYDLSQLDDVLPRGDMVINCLPNTDKTAGLLHRDRLFAMKRSAVLVNIGRGSALPLEDLMVALEEGHFRGVALDVYEREPLPTDHPLWDVERVHMTPHIAGIGFGNVPLTEDKIIALFCENLRLFAEGQPLKRQVNFATGYAE